MTAPARTCERIVTRCGSVPVRRVAQLMLAVDAAIAVWSVLLVRRALEHSPTFDAVAPHWAYDRYVGLAVAAGGAFVLLAAGARLYAVRQPVPWRRVPLILLANCAVVYAVVALLGLYYSRATFGGLLFSRRSVFFALLLMYVGSTVAHYARRRWLAPLPASDAHH